MGMKRLRVCLIVLLSAIAVGCLFWLLHARSVDLPDGTIYMLTSSDGVLYRYDWKGKSLQIVPGFQDVRVLEFCAAGDDSLWLHVQRADGQNILWLWDQSTVQWEQEIDFAPETLCAFRDGVLLVRKRAVDALTPFRGKKLGVYRISTGDILYLDKETGQIEDLTECVDAVSFLAVQDDRIGFLRPDLYVRDGAVRCRRENLCVYENGESREIPLGEDIEGLYGCGDACLVWKENGLFRYSLETGIGEKIKNTKYSIASKAAINPNGRFLLSLQPSRFDEYAYSYAVRLTDGKRIRLKGIKVPLWDGGVGQYCWVNSVPNE